MNAVAEPAPSDTLAGAVPPAPKRPIDGPDADPVWNRLPASLAVCVEVDADHPSRAGQQAGDGSHRDIPVTGLKKRN